MTGVYHPLINPPGLQARHINQLSKNLLSCFDIHKPIKVDQARGAEQWMDGGSGNKVKYPKSS